MRIAEVCPYDMTVPGGVQTQVRGLAGELRRRGHHVDIVGPGAPGWEWLGPVVPVPSNDAVARVALGPHIRRRLPRSLSRYDVIHVHEPLMPAVASVASRSGVPVVGTLHADPSTLVRRLLKAGFGRRTLRRLVVITAVSPVARSALPHADIEIIPNAIDEALMVPDGKRAGSVLFVGRDEPRKGLSVLLDAWPKVRQSVPHARLAVISDRVTGPEGIDWLGRLEDSARIDQMRRAQILCAPNLRGESFGMVVAEALGAGCSVVAADLPAFRWVAGEAADFVPVGDPDALAARMIDRLARPRPADDQRRHARRFRWAEVGRRYEQILVEVRRSA